LLGIIELKTFLVVKLGKVSSKTRKKPYTESSALLSAARRSLSQDPHRVRDTVKRNLEVAIGHEVRMFRRQQGLTVADLAKATGLSIGMLSKIENGVTSPSLSTLQEISNSLSVPLTSLFRGYEEQREVKHVKAGEHVEIERRGSRAGRQYHLLGHIGANNSGVVVEPYLIVLTTESDVFPVFQHDGIELLYMLEGEIEYRHGEERFHLKPGDSLFFDADAQHGPVTLIKLPAKYLSVIAYPQG
jgi:transcriptional regulator with XRE-family HTH domain